jgi:hypothetical protein
MTSDSRSGHFSVGVNVTTAAVVDDATTELVVGVIVEFETLTGIVVVNQ